MLYAAIKARLKAKPGWQNAKSIRGVTEETTTGVHRLYIMAKEGSSCGRRSTSMTATKSKFDNLYGCRESLVDGIRRVPTPRCRQGGNGCGPATSAKARPRACATPAAAMVSEVDPICALQAAMDGHEVTTMDDAAPRADIFVTATGNVDVITDYMRAMHDCAVVGTSATSTPRSRSARSTKGRSNVAAGR